MIYLDMHGHLFSDKTVHELWTFAQDLGLTDGWNHYSAGFPHFDLTGSKLNRAPHLGAKRLETRREVVALIKKMREKVFNMEWVRQCAVTYSDKGRLGQHIMRLDIRETIKNEILTGRA